MWKLLNIHLLKGRTILLNGPASVTLKEGKITALGFRVPIHKKVIIRKNKTIPFEAEENSTLEVVLSDNASFEEVDGSTIPDSWKVTADAILKLPKPCTILILGEVDCGKNAFSIFLVNRALAFGLKPTVIDADIGQPEIGPPTAIGSTSVSR